MSLRGCVGLGGLHAYTGDASLWFRERQGIFPASAASPETKWCIQPELGLAVV